MSDTDQTQVSLVTALERSNELMAEPNADLSLAVQKISGELRDVSWSSLACRVLFRCAVLEGSSNRARFVSLVLSARGHVETARLLADHGASSGAKPWQRRRLAEICDIPASVDPAASSRGRFCLEVVDDGQVRMSEGPVSEAGVLAPVDNHCEREGAPSVPDTGWLPDLITALDREPIGIHHDVLTIKIGNGEHALRSLRSVLPAIQLLPVVPVLLASSATAVPDIIESLISIRADSLSPVIAAPTHSGEYGLITAGGGELLDAGPTEDLVLGTVDDVVSVASAVGLLDLYDSPVLNTQRAGLVESFRTESAALLPVQNSTRAFSRALRFRGTSRTTSQLRARLMEHLVASGFSDEAQALLNTALPSVRDRVRGALSMRSVPAQGHHEFESVDTFAGPVPAESSTYTIAVGGLPVDLRFDDRGFDTTVVFFHPAITKAVKRFPLFSGATFSEHLKANRLFVSDPSLYVDQRLKLGWYAGNKHQPKLQDDLAAIISKFVAPEQRLIFFGASGGGFASLFYSTKFPGSIAVPVNPQTMIGAYVPAIVNRYLSYAWDGSALDEIPVCTDVRGLYQNPVDNVVVYVQNSGDSDHMDNHYAPFMDALPKDHRVSSLLVDAGEGHVPPPRDQLGQILEEVICGAFPGERP
ncbi:hypothetical protein [Brevibacterium aurantiacum]|uniref:Alpha/beta hydrolase n=1 Tax=Brevibacterium aurantiacum TaxID=273384 RepID=A0A556C991_BREAU|nr:hypothetical protein [Brevibacterium aurantiacum]TSI13950.1 hypothetical protein FO013_16715 [Brevibacterium aurantiacum]